MSFVRLTHSLSIARALTQNKWIDVNCAKAVNGRFAIANMWWMMIDAVRFGTRFFLPILQCPCDHPFFLLLLIFCACVTKIMRLHRLFCCLPFFLPLSLTISIHSRKNLLLLLYVLKPQAPTQSQFFLLRWPVCTTITLIYKGFGWSLEHSDSADGSSPIATTTTAAKCCKCHLMLKTPFDKLIDSMVIPMTHRWKMNATTPKVPVKSVLMCESVAIDVQNSAQLSKLVGILMLIHRCLLVWAAQRHREHSFNSTQWKNNEFLSKGKKMKRSLSIVITVSLRTKLISYQMASKEGGRRIKWVSVSKRNGTERNGAAITKAIPPFKCDKRDKMNPFAFVTFVFNSHFLLSPFSCFNS